MKRRCDVCILCTLVRMCSTYTSTVCDIMRDDRHDAGEHNKSTLKVKRSTRKMTTLVTDEKSGGAGGGEE